MSFSAQLQGQYGFGIPGGNMNMQMGQPMNGQMGQMGQGVVQPMGMTPTINLSQGGNMNQGNNMNQMGMNQMGGIQNLGMNQMGMNQMGMNQNLGMNQKFGMNQMGGNQMGVNQMGGNQMGVNQIGMNQMGVNQMGVNQMGMNQGIGMSQGMGMNQMGMNQMGMNQGMGMNQMGMNQGMGMGGQREFERQGRRRRRSREGEMGFNQMGSNTPMGVTNVNVTIQSPSGLNNMANNISAMGVNTLGMNTLGMNTLGMNTLGVSSMNTMGTMGMSNMGMSSMQTLMPGVDYKIVSALNPCKVFDVDRGSSSPNYLFVSIYDLHGGPNQRFNFASMNGKYMIQTNALPTMSLDTQTGVPKLAITNGAMSQQFSVLPIVSGVWQGKAFQIISSSGLALCANSSVINGTKIMQQPMQDGVPNQVWLIVPM